jgi:hypothetical protein
VLDTLLRARLIFEEAIAVGITVEPDPLEDAAGGRQERAHHRPVVRPDQVLPQHAEEVDRRRPVAVVAAEGIDAQGGQRSPARLMDHLAGLFIEEVVYARPLPGGIRQQAVTHWALGREKRLPGDGEAVPAEELLVERQAGDRDGGPFF